MNRRRPAHLHAGQKRGQVLPAHRVVSGQGELLPPLGQGDSMIEAGIGDQDYVLIQQQSTVENRDIVVVAIDDEATLKRVVRMGDSVADAGEPQV